VRSPPPPGYRRFLIKGAEVVARAELLDALRSSLAAGSFYAFAAQHPHKRVLSGRGAAYAVPLPGTDVRIVVRHNRHGGLFAPITGDRFFAPTRAPYELEAALQLGELGIETPQILAYAVYNAGSVLRRSDVVTREVPRSRDLADILMHGDDETRGVALLSAARLIGSLAVAGVRHHDLNAKNILLASDDESDEPRALLLDVDRVTFHAPQDVTVLDGNLERFARSARKWRERYGARISEGELDRLALVAREQLATQPAPSTRA
jgi:tRNA A-37 threonylcarbamoyl transferase component Bud32